MPTLYDELHIGTLAARNRAVRAATAESLATRDGAPTPQLRALYEELAAGGVGTIITGYAYVTPDGKPSEGALGICSDSFLGEYRALVDAVHARGAAIVLQLVYGGSKSKLTPGDARRIEDACGGPNVSILGASPVENPKTHLIPREASAEELAQVAREFGAAAARAASCGFDGVEVHVAHGYLLSQFLSPRFNERGDEYGGSLRNRARLACECIAAVRSAVGEGFPVLAKVNSCDDAADPAGERGGLGEDGSAQVCAWLVEAGASCIDVSGDWHAATAHAEAGEPYFAQFGARIARSCGAPVIVTGGWRDLAAIESHLASDGIAAVGMSRPLICEPDLINRWQSGDTRPSICIACGSCQKAPGVPCPQRERANS